jgi:hypothetical protein
VLTIVEPCLPEVVGRGLAPIPIAVSARAMNEATRLSAKFILIFLPRMMFTFLKKEIEENDRARSTFLIRTRWRSLLIR